jgi:hypothetical protein
MRSWLDRTAKGWEPAWLSKSSITLRPRFRSRLEMSEFGSTFRLALSVLRSLSAPTTETHRLGTYIATVAPYPVRYGALRPSQINPRSNSPHDTTDSLAHDHRASAARARVRHKVREAIVTAAEHRIGREIIEVGGGPERRAPKRARRSQDAGGAGRVRVRRQSNCRCRRQAPWARRRDARGSRGSQSRRPTIRLQLEERSVSSAVQQAGTEPEGFPGAPGSDLDMHSRCVS